MTYSAATKKNYSKNNARYQDIRDLLDENDENETVVTTPKKTVVAKKTVIKTTEELFTDKLIEDITKSEKLPWHKPWTNINPVNIVTNVAYTGINQTYLSMIGAIKGYKTPYWATLKQFKAIDERVNKDEKGTLATRCVFIYITKDENTTLKPMYWGKDYLIKAARGKHLSVKYDGKKIIVGSSTYVEQVRLKTFKVFNVAQTTYSGELLNENVVHPTKEQSHTNFDTMMSNYQNCCEIVDNVPQNEACYIPSKDIVKLPMQSQFNTLNEYYSTKGHEVAHSTGHESRLNRDMSQQKELYSFEELVAELTAAMLCGYCGIDNSGTYNNSVAYLQGWLSKLSSEKFIVKALSKATVAYQYITQNKTPNY